MNALEPIQTNYNGCRFRSRLEARWAVFFDACGVNWDYEPEGYALSNGQYYLPDFLLHGVTIHHGGHRENCDIYVEVKGRMNDADADKIKRFAEAGMPEDGMCGLSRTAIIVVGSIPWGETYSGLIDYIQREAYNDHCGWPNYYNFATIDTDYFAAYPGVDKEGKFSLLGDDSTYLNYMDVAATLRAYKTARQARFEYMM